MGGTATADPSAIAPSNDILSKTLDTKIKFSNEPKPSITKDSLPDEYFYENQDIDAFQLFYKLKYMKVSRKAKLNLGICRRMFLAQELDTTKTQESPVVSETMSHDDNILSVTSSGLRFSASHTLPVTSRKSLENSDEANAIWSLQFSPDGRYLAAGGKDSILRVYKVISSPLDRLEYEHSKQQPQSGTNIGSFDTESVTDSVTSPAKSVDRTSKQCPFHEPKPELPTYYAPLFHENPHKEFVGHTQDILSLDWSKNNFLLSSSMDRTVRLWHVDRQGCLQVFKHCDFVTSARFHPLDDRFFISGSLDKQIRLWSILDGTVLYHQTVSHMITTCEFFCKGDFVAVGTINGLIYIYETKGLVFAHQIDLKTNSIKNLSSAKVSSIDATDICNEAGEVIDSRLLITTNDAKLRLYSVKKKKVLMKFKGLQSTTSQAMATTDEDQKYVLAVSDDDKIYCWQVNDRDILSKAKRKAKGVSGIFKKSSTEKNERLTVDDPELPENIKNVNFTAIHAHDSPATAISIAPAQTRKLLSLSNDPIYDLCSTFCEIIDDESSASLLPDLESAALLKRVMSKNSTSSGDSTLYDDDDDLPKSKVEEEKQEKRRELLMTAKSLKHVDAVLSLLDPLSFPIVVSADITGKIRVFRIDSAYQIRKILSENFSASKKKRKDDGMLNLEPFFKQLNRHEGYLISQRMGALDLSSDNLSAAAKPGKHSGRRRSFVQRRSKSKDPFVSPRSKGDRSTVFSISSAGETNSFDEPENDSTLKNLVAEQNSAIHNDVKDEILQPKRNGSFYSLNNRSNSINSLLLNRSHGPPKQVCSDCQGTKFAAKKVQYKNGPMIAKVCQDCGSQVNV